MLHTAEQYTVNSIQYDCIVYYCIHEQHTCVLYFHLQEINCQFAMQPIKFKANPDQCKCEEDSRFTFEPTT